MPSDVLDLAEVAGVPFNGPDLDRNDLAAVRAYSEDHATEAAGVFLAGARAWIGFTRQPSRHLSTLRGSLSQPQRVGAFRAANCLADLRDLHARINADHPYLSDAGIEITMVGVSETQNRLELWTASSLSAEQRVCSRAGTPKNNY